MHEKRSDHGDEQHEGDVDTPRESRYDLAKLVAGITPENAHPEVDCGEARGEEAW